MSPWGASSLLNLLTYFPEKAQRVSKRVETASRRFKFTRQGGFSMDRRVVRLAARARRCTHGRASFRPHPHRLPRHRVLIGRGCARPTRCSSWRA
jgi:hypothetical protein